MVYGHIRMRRRKEKKNYRNELVRPREALVKFKMKNWPDVANVLRVRGSVITQTSCSTTYPRAGGISSYYFFFSDSKNIQIKNKRLALIGRLYIYTSNIGFHWRLRQFGFLSSLGALLLLLSFLWRSIDDFLRLSSPLECAIALYARQSA